MSKIHHFKGFSVVDGDMKIKLNMDRFSRQYQEAQYLLDEMVMDSMVPFMPMITGDFINRTRVESGAKKVLVSQFSGRTAAKENLEYTKQAHPQAQAEWFDAAKRQYGSTWIRKVKAQAGGGRHGR